MMPRMMPDPKPVHRRASFERRRPSRGPQGVEAGPGASNNPIPPLVGVASGMDRNFYLAHGDLSHICRDAPPEGLSTGMDANLYLAHEASPG
jgi:hypothetical protein